MKHRKTKRKISNKQATTIIISVLCAAALLIGLLVVIGPILGGNTGGHYEGDGHDHGSSNLGNGHYEGDGHDHGSSNNSANANAKVKYQIYTNADKTYRVVFRDIAGKTVAEFDNIKAKNSLLPAKAVSGSPDVYELGWATGSGANEFECIYYNVKTGQVSDKLTAPRGTDGVRVAYASVDQKKVIVQSLFDKSYYKTYVLTDAYTGEGDIIIGGALQKDNKTVTVSYKNKDGEARHLRIDLYA